MSWFQKLGRATHLWGSGNSALSYMSGNVDYRRNRDMANTAYQRAAADKKAAGINPLFDGAAASPVPVSQSGPNSAAASSKIFEAMALPLNLLSSALSAVNVMADTNNKNANTATIDQSRSWVVQQLEGSTLLQEMDYNLKHQLLMQLKEMNPIALEQARKALEQLDLSNQHSRADLNRAWNEADMEKFFSGPAGNWLRLLRGFFNSGAAK